MSLQKQLGDYKRELADTAARNSAYTRPGQTGSDTTKRNHDTAFSKSTPKSPAPASTPAASTPPTTSVIPSGGTELLTQVYHAISYVKTKPSQAISFTDITNYLSLPNDLQKHIPHILSALKHHERVTYLPKHVSPNGRESFKYRPPHPVTNADELKTYLASQPTSAGIPVKELRDGWPDCNTHIDALEKENHVLVTRNKKDNTPKLVWFDSPSYHLHIDSDFHDFWNKTRLPTTENEIRNELEKAGLTSTSQVKEIKKMDIKKDRKRANRRGGKTTNQHMSGILRDYSKR